MASRCHRLDRKSSKSRSPFKLMQQFHRSRERPGLKHARLGGMISYERVHALLSDGARMDHPLVEMTFTKLMCLTDLDTRHTWIEKNSILLQLGRLIGFVSGVQLSVNSVR